MNVTEVNKAPGQAAERTPFGKMVDQVDALETALNTIKSGTCESESARAYIVGQIEALRWAIRINGG
jgi:hypothetical protein